MRLSNERWVGIAKVIEETGELGTVLGKLMEFPDGDHPDGAGDLRTRVIEEVADALAAIDFFARENLTIEECRELSARYYRKDAQYREWDASTTDRMAGVITPEINKET